ncbi:hypothetical protein EWB00_001641 [Schistosoma japonicum]|uniref:Uncharacterized protein n=1 Tax=Schistosoma japonicum TaxID=6182 RepID=C1LGX1_SCHJA|nr:hypothetical protein KSF78_0002591 [Schistosoma japonicum]TNN15079.1 hypothetical protein EWB00_001641 [Schistosoma japonicum]CAX73949.1 hypothetical protein [Schistosoma japonicum]
MFTYINLMITVILIKSIIVQGILSRIKKTYKYDCATVKADINENSGYEYKYKLELTNFQDKFIESTSNEVTLCNIPMCTPQVLNYTVYVKKTPEGAYEVLASEIIKTSLEGLKIEKIRKDSPIDNQTVLKWDLRHYDYCNDREVLFVLFGDKTIMQMAKGDEIRIPFLTSGKEYTVYAVPNSFPEDTRIFTSEPFVLVV